MFCPLAQINNSYNPDPVTIRFDKSMNKPCCYLILVIVFILHLSSSLSAQKKRTIRHLSTRLLARVAMAIPIQAQWFRLEWFS